MTSVISIVTLLMRDDSDKYQTPSYGMTGIEIQSPPLIPPQGGKQALPPPSEGGNKNLHHKKPDTGDCHPPPQCPNV